MYIHLECSPRINRFPANQSDEQYPLNMKDEKNKN